jgi:hypothetical protein
MMHQLSVLFYPVALALLWRDRKDRFWSTALGYSVISPGLTLVAYGLAYRLASHKPAVTVSGWLSFHAVPFVFNPMAAAGWLMLGTARLFVGGRLGLIAYLVGPVSLGVVLWAIWRLVKMRGEFLSVLPVWPILVWAGIYISFLFVWEPHNTFYRLFYLTPLVALLAVATRALPARPLGAIAAALLCWNFCVFIYPNTRVGRNQLLTIALAQHKVWPPGTGVVFSQLVPDLWAICYFNPQVSWISMEQPDPARVVDYATQMARNGSKLYLDWTYLNSAGRPTPRFHFEEVKQISLPGATSQ